MTVKEQVQAKYILALEKEIDRIKTCACSITPGMAPPCWVLPDKEEYEELHRLRKLLKTS